MRRARSAPRRSASRPRHLDGLFEQPREQPRVAARGRGAGPSGWSGTPARTPPGRAPARAPAAAASRDESLELADRRVAIEDDRLGLHAGDADGSVHADRLCAVERGAELTRRSGRARRHPARPPRPRAEPTTMPSTSAAAARACVARRDAEAGIERLRGRCTGSRSERRERRGELGARAGRCRSRVTRYSQPSVDSAARRSRSSVDVGATSWTRRVSGRTSTGRSATINDVAPALRASVAKRSQP